MITPQPPVVLSCGHVEIEEGRCATIDCPNFVHRVEPDGDTFTWVEAPSMLTCLALMSWVRSETGRGAFEIIFDALPQIPGIG